MRLVRTECMVEFDWDAAGQDAKLAVTIGGNGLFGALAGRLLAEVTERDRLPVLCRGDCCEWFVPDHGSLETCGPACKQVLNREAARR